MLTQQRIDETLAELVGHIGCEAEIEDIKAVLRYIQKSLYGEEFHLTERVSVQIPDNRRLVEFVDVTESEYSVLPHLESERLRPQP